MVMVLNKIGVFSAGKITAVLYAGLGLIAGVFISMFSFLGAFAGAMSEQEGALIGLFFGVGAVIFLPVFYGIMGFIGGIITALLYNLAAGVIGGLELDLE
jgi:hypothetical protein